MLVDKEKDRESRNTQLLPIVDRYNANRAAAFRRLKYNYNYSIASFVHKRKPYSLFFNLDDAMHVTSQTRLPRFSRTKIIIKKRGGA